MSTTVHALPSTEEAPTSSLGVQDIIFILFKHKRTILICAAIGLVAGMAAFLLQPPVYQSQAKLLVRYLVERNAVDAVDSNSDVSGGRNAAAIASEVEILTSRDLAEQVAEGIGVKRLGDEKGAPSVMDAAGIITRTLHVESSTNSNILSVSYRSRDPQIPQRLLQELVSRYFVKHLEVHRSAGAFEFVTQQTEQVRMRLNQTEAALKPLREQVGIISLADGRAALSADLARTEAQLHAAEADLAEQRGRVKELGESPATSSGPRKGTVTKSKGKSTSEAEVTGQFPVEERDNVPPSPAPKDPASSGQIEQYQEVTSGLAKLRQTKFDLLSKYKPGSVQVQLTQTQIDNLEKQRADLEKKFPDLHLHSTVPKTGTSTGESQMDFGSEKANLAGMEAKVDTLKARLQEIQAKAKQLNELGPQIAELERTKELEETNFKYFQATLQKSRIDEALDPAKIPNISTVQAPTPPERVGGTRRKLALLLAGAGLALGLGIAAVSELVLNRTVKRPLDLERQLNSPVLLSIPYTPANGRLRLTAGTHGKELEPYRNGNGSNGLAIAPWSDEHFIRPYCEAIRDRFSLYFELNHLTHKPKLVGVTSFSHAAGTSTLAAGLASALSETDEGKVLLVDVNLGPGDVHPFFKGKPAYPLATALQQSGPISPAADNLYLATIGSAKSGPAQLGLKRFFDLMPNLKASDFDYIIFDMPPLDQTSPTWALSPFMDKLLLIVQSETTNKEVVSRGYNKLVGERDNVSVVFNKVQSYAPKWISGEE